MKIQINALDPSSVDKAIKQLEEYAKDLDRKAQMLCERLADMGAMYAEWNFSGVLYASDNIEYKVDRVQEEPNKYVIRANGQSVLFMEFGAGVKYGYGHPQASEFGMGPGTYPGKGHWDDPKGWWFGEKGHWTHTYGNAPGMSMYNAAKDLRSEIQQVAQEVFKS